MATILDFYAMKTRKSRKKESKAGRKKTRWFRLNLTHGGRDAFIQVRPEVVAAAVGVSKATVYHWIAGTKTPAPVTMALLEVMLGGTLPFKGWQQWRMCPETGRLISPNGHSFMPGELGWISLQKALISELQREVLALRIANEQLRVQVNEQAANNIIPLPARKRS